jgi:protein SCO1/2
MRWGLLIAATTALAACSPSNRSGVDPACFSRSSEQIGGPFKLTAHTGATMTQEDFKGRKTLVFFGFTHCPDVCPDTLFRVGTAMTMLPPNKKPPRTALISVDPVRDTPEALSQYIKSNGFPADIVGLTGTLDELQQVAKAFAAPFSRDETSESASGYIVNHSAILYLMDENWKLETFFQPGARPADIAACIAALD